jgi:hypothetical protein
MLAPPIALAFERNNVLPNGQVFACAQVARVWSVMKAAVGKGSAQPFVEEQK